MKVQNISSNCCPKPKPSFNGASITPKAIKALTQSIAKHIDEMDEFKAIGKLDVNIDLDKRLMDKIECVAVTAKDNPNVKVIAPVFPMKHLREAIEKILVKKQ